MSDEIHLRLKWRRTWDDRENDFCGYDRNSGKRAGRIYLRSTGGFLNGQWSWFFGGSTGTEPTAREAAKVIEDLWFRYHDGAEG